MTMWKSKEKDILQELLSFSSANQQIRIMKEIVVEEADGRYFVIPQGQVISFCKDEPRVMAQNDNGNGYLYITIGKKNYYIHRLVAKAFIKNDDEEKTIIHHLDRDRSNNEVSNLIYVSPKRHQLIHNFLNKWDNAVIPFDD